MVTYVIVGTGMMSALLCADSGVSPLSFIGLPLLYLIQLVGTWLFQMVMIRGSLMIVDSRLSLRVKSWTFAGPGLISRERTSSAELFTVPPAGLEPRLGGF